MLPDVTLLRSWWLPGAIQGGLVHDKLAPLLQNFLAAKCGLAVERVWDILRFAGDIHDDDGNVDAFNIIIKHTGHNNSNSHTNLQAHSKAWPHALRGHLETVDGGLVPGKQI